MRTMQTHRRGRKRKSVADLEGKAVVAPRSVWPDLPLPAGERGWRGTVGKRKDASHHYVAFPDDPQKYFFLTKDVEKWVVQERSTGGGSSRAAAAAPAPSSGGGSPTKRSGKAAAEPASPTKATPKASPSKEAKAAANDGTLVLARLRNGIDGMLDRLDVEAMREAYEAVHQVVKKHRH